LNQLEVRRDLSKLEMSKNSIWERRRRTQRLDQDARWITPLLSVHAARHYAPELSGRHSFNIIRARIADVKLPTDSVIDRDDGDGRLSRLIGIGVPAMN